METSKGPQDPLKNLCPGLTWIWHGVNDSQNLKFFIKSNVYWAEGDVRLSEGGILILRHDPFETHPARAEESILEARDWVSALNASERGIQIDLKGGGETLEQVIRLVRDFRIPSERLWFTTNLKDISTDDYARLNREFPGVPLQSAIPLRFMFQEMTWDERRDWLELNRSVGVRHLAMSWYEEPTAQELDELREAGFKVHFFYVDTVSDLQKAAALKPDSITSDFHLPEWGFFGRGSGENGYYKVTSL